MGCLPLADVSLCFFVRVFRQIARESLRITDNFTSLMSIECPPTKVGLESKLWTSFFRSPLFGPTLAHLVKTSGNFGGLDLFQGHLVRTFSSLDHRLFQEAILKTFLVFPICDPSEEAPSWSENSPICVLGVLLLIFEL